jgi:hypothetical protein
MSTVRVHVNLVRQFAGVIRSSEVTQQSLELVFDQTVCLNFCTDWRHRQHAEAKGPKLEDFLSVGYGNDRSSGSIYDASHADQLKYHHHQDVHAYPGSPYFQGNGGGGAVLGLDINNAPPPSHCTGLPDHHYMPAHHSQYSLCPPNHQAAGAGAMAAAPMYSSAVGFDGNTNMSISGIKSWLRQSMYVPERSPAVPPSVHAAPSEPPLPAPCVPVPRKLAQTFGQRTSQFRGVTRLLSRASSCLVLQRSDVRPFVRSWIHAGSCVDLQAQVDGEVRGTPVGQHLQEGRPDQERKAR